jgi:hypothetical protein
MLACAAVLLVACGKPKVVPPKQYPVAAGFFYVTVPADVEFGCRPLAIAAIHNTTVCIGQTATSKMGVATAKYDLETSKLEDGFRTGMSDAAALMDSSISSSSDAEVNGIPAKDFKLRTLRGSAYGRIYVGNGFMVYSIAEAKAGNTDDDAIALASTLQPIKPKT